MNIAPLNVKKILLVRTDRIGDVVLSLPMLPVLKKHFPAAAITMMVRKYTRELVEHHSCVDDILQWEANGERSLFEYVNIIRAEKFDIAILPYPRFKLALIISLAGVPIRVGTGYRWYSFLFNRKRFEHRKDAQRHEVEYNLNLLRSIGIEENVEPQFELNIPDEIQRSVDTVLHHDHVEQFAVLHVGSGGSARDWSLENFASLGEHLQQELHLGVVFTGAENEKSLVNEVIGQMKTSVTDYTGRFSLKELGALLRRASVFISNSTGPLHIASAVGTPVVGFYPPIVQCSPVRWGPYTVKKKVFTAESNQCPLCKGGPCQSNVCMNQISVHQVIKGIKELLNEHS
jgi:heptosyltransferase-3